MKREAVKRQDWRGTWLRMTTGCYLLSPDNVRRHRYKLMMITIKTADKDLPGCIAKRNPLFSSQLKDNGTTVAEGTLEMKLVCGKLGLRIPGRWKTYGNISYNKQSTRFYLTLTNTQQWQPLSNVDTNKTCCDNKKRGETKLTNTNIIGACSASGGLAVVDGSAYA